MGAEEAVDAAETVERVYGVADMKNTAVEACFYRAVYIPRRKGSAEREEILGVSRVSSETF